MPRSILTSATLAACLAAGVPLALPFLQPTRDERSSARAEIPSVPPLLTLAGRSIAVHLSGPVVRGGTLGVALLLQPGDPPEAIRLWAGRKNGWGSISCIAEAVPGVDGLLAASVAISELLPTQARLWLAIERDHARPATASLALPG